MTARRTSTRRRRPRCGSLDIETLRVLADPLRLRMLEVFGQHGREPLTVKEIARSLGEPLTKLYYHVNLLEQHGLIVVASSRLVSGILEKHYRPQPTGSRSTSRSSRAGPGWPMKRCARSSPRSSTPPARTSRTPCMPGRARLSEEDEDGETSGTGPALEGPRPAQPHRRRRVPPTTQGPLRGVRRPLRRRRPT